MPFHGARAAEMGMDVAVAGVGWPRAVPHNATHLYVFYSAGGIDFWTNGTNHIADTGLVSAALVDRSMHGCVRL